MGAIALAPTNSRRGQFRSPLACGVLLQLLSKGEGVRIAAPFTDRGPAQFYVIHNVIHYVVPKLVVRRTGNSLGLPIPHAIVRQLGLVAGDEVLVEIERLPQFLALAGSLKGKITAEEFTKLSNEGEEVD